MIFMIFLLIAVWNLPLDLWLQICLTIFGSLHALFNLGFKLGSVDDN